MQGSKRPVPPPLHLDSNLSSGELARLVGESIEDVGSEAEPPLPFSPSVVAKQCVLARVAAAGGLHRLRALIAAPSSCRSRRTRYRPAAAAAARSALLLPPKRCRLSRIGAEALLADDLRTELLTPEGRAQIPHPT